MKHACAMMCSMSARRFLLLVGDIATFYLALFVTLWLRWGIRFHYSIFQKHLLPFSIILVFGLWVFYSMRLYDSAFGVARAFWVQSASAALFLQFMGAVLFFYFFSRWVSAITPRGTLFLFFLVFGTLFLLWRGFAERLERRKKGERTIIFADVEEGKKLGTLLTEHPELGYRVIAVLPKENLESKRLSELIHEESLETVIAERYALENLARHSALEDIAKLKVNFWDLATFYESKLGKIPVGLVRETWILENIVRYESPLREALKQFLDTFFASLLLLLTLPLWPLIALGVKFSSPGPVFYGHRRVGTHGREFTLRKFRSMVKDAEAHGPQWATPNDPRVTSFGRFIRYTHLDELPQLLSIIKGDLSFVGPRPERPEFVKELRTAIPFYDVRHLIKPGFTGWAQINYPYGASVEDAREKLEYDLYYLKHRSLLLDLSIILKTIRLLFQNPQK